MKIVSFHNGHNANFCLLDNNKIISHIELEKELGIKNFGMKRENKNLLYEYLTNFQLKKVNWSLQEIDAFVFTTLNGYFGTWQETEFKNECLDLIYDKNIKNPYKVFEKKWKNKNRIFFSVNHHISHLAYGYYTSPFQESLIIACDGRGEFNVSTVFANGTKNTIVPISDLLHFNDLNLEYNSIGMTFSYLGFLLDFLGKDLIQTPGKAMGLSSYGKYDENFKEFIVDILKEKKQIKQKLEKIKKNNFKNSESTEARNFLFTLQKESEDIIINYLKKIKNKNKNLVVSGGVALNVLINQKIRKSLFFDNIYIPPACNDMGNSIGAGLYFYHHFLNNKFDPILWHNPYIGNELNINHDKIQEKNLIKKTFKNFENLINFIVEKLIKGKIIGWVQDKIEIGPRALGNRSILANPMFKDSKDIVNKKVKHREYWRPFAPICIYEEAHKWFEINFESPYMLEAVNALPNVENIIPSVIHVDNTARIQTLKRFQNEKLYKLLNCFYEKTKVPILLNTSFNDKNKPILNNSCEAFNIINNTDLDLLCIGNTIWEKNNKNILHL